MTIDLYTARCASCGLLIRHHRDGKNRSLTCLEAAKLHPRASVRKRALRSLLALPRKEQP